MGTSTSTSIASYLRSLSYAKLGKSISPAIAKRSADVSEKIFSTWHDPSAALLYSFDMELDDKLRIMHIIPKWLQSKSPAALIMVAGERNGGGNRDTFGELAKQVAELTGATVSDLEIQAGSEAGSVDIGGIAVIRGAPLKTDKGAVKTGAAAARVTSALKGRSYVLHNNTSAALPAALSDEVYSKCRAHVITCGREILAPEHPFTGANYEFDPVAYDSCEERSRRLGVDMVNIHGSTLGVIMQTLSELDGWGELLSVPVEDPAPWQQKIRFCMNQSLQWTGRLLGALTDTSGEDVSNVIAGLMKKPLESLDADAVASSEEWTKKPRESDTYGADGCTLEGKWRADKRVKAIKYMMDCPITNTIGDYVASVLDALTTLASLLLLPLRVDFGDKDKGIAPSLTMDDSPDAPLVATNVDESVFLDIHRAVWARLKADSASGSGVPMVDEKLAREWTVFSKVMGSLLKRTIEAADDRMKIETEGSNVWDAASNIRSELLEASKNLSSGAMTTLCRDVTSA